LQISAEQMVQPHGALRNESSLLVPAIDLPNLSFWTLLDRQSNRQQRVTDYAGSKETGAVGDTDNSAFISEPDGGA
jgi:hypothetical protein